MKFLFGNVSHKLNHVLEASPSPLLPPQKKSKSKKKFEKLWLFQSVMNLFCRHVRVGRVSPEKWSFWTSSGKVIAEEEAAVDLHRYGNREKREDLVKPSRNGEIFPRGAVMRTLCLPLFSCFTSLAPSPPLKSLYLLLF